MPKIVRRTVKRLKLVYLWVVRILFAPNHFGVHIWTRLRYAIVGGFVPDQVVLYDLRHNPRSLYLSEFDWYKSRWINEPFDPMLNNKIVCAAVLKEHIATPPVLFIKNKSRCVMTGVESPESSEDDALRMLSEWQTVFMKPIGAGKGKGVCRLDCVNGEYSIDGTVVYAEEMLELLKAENGWFLSPTVEQHPVLARIFPETTNTIRLITLRDPATERLKIFFAVLRIGTAATVPVDNGSRGGLVAQIDLETGRLSEARTLWSLDTFDRHPDSGSAIRGVTIPDWDHVKSEMLRVGDQFPFLQFIAWDILCSSEGPVVIEANTSSGVNIIQLWGPQRGGELGDFYREHGVIK